MGYSADQLNDEDFIIQMEILRKNRQKAKMGAMALKKQTTFGLTERFAPVPGSTQSKSQQRLVKSIKKVMRLNSTVNSMKPSNFSSVTSGSTSNNGTVLLADIIEPSNTLLKQNKVITKKQTQGRND